MAHWLIKSEPSSWSWDRQVAAGRDGTSWNGVRNHSAKLHLTAMRVGDQAFFYHSNQGKAIMGIVAVTKPYYPDPTDETGRFGTVDFVAVRPFQSPVTLDAVKAEPELKDMALVNNPRLSVQPVTTAEWRIVCRMGDRSSCADASRAGGGA